MIKVKGIDWIVPQEDMLLNCKSNVEKMVERYGGKAVTGWRIEKGELTTTKLHHVAWESPDGQLLEVTPTITDRMNLEFSDIEFERDDAALFVNDKCLPSRYFANTTDRRVVEACDYMTRSDRCFIEQDLAGCQYWTTRANDKIAKTGSQSNWIVPASLEDVEVLEWLGSGSISI